VLASTASDQQKEVVLVEGPMDTHHLRADGVDDVAAFGRPWGSGDLFERLDQLGVQRVTIYLDDNTLRAAIDHAARATRSPDIWVNHWRALDLTTALDQPETEQSRRARLAHAGAWLSTRARVTTVTPSSDHFAPGSAVEASNIDPPDGGLASG